MEAGHCGITFKKSGEEKKKDLFNCHVMFLPQARSSLLLGGVVWLVPLSVGLFRFQITSETPVATLKHQRRGPLISNTVLFNCTVK